MMAADAGIRIALVQQTQHLVEHHHLFRRAVVLAVIFRRVADTALVAYADAVGVVSRHMAALHADGSAVVQRTVTTHIQVVPRIVAIAACLVAALQSFYREVLRRPCGRAVQYDEVNCPR